MWARAHNALLYTELVAQRAEKYRAPTFPDGMQDRERQWQIIRADRIWQTKWDDQRGNPEEARGKVGRTIRFRRNPSDTLGRSVLRRRQPRDSTAAAKRNKTKAQHAMASVGARGCALILLIK
eukprot:TRINITY_DN6933_c0_g1_i2.p5 TRINITY_DN6933_c0_g1~~TRINITY_DN6933_c0_g1_i2.p5  ORF type:complete len:123 (-),score=12.23 TRINITY_DN6933_c0_g1_i2:158-526(-)